jgi:HEAT repeat protein
MTAFPMSRSLTLALLLLLGPATSKAAPSPELRAETCSVDGLLDSIREGLHSKSAAYQRYLRTLLSESALTLPVEQLHTAFARERDPVLAEHLATALVARTDRGADEAALGAVARRALEDADPAIRAASVRALRRSSALERTGDMYERLMRDPSPEVREEAATNLLEDNLHVYSGLDGPAADLAVAAAAASVDPRLTAKLLGNLSTQAISDTSADTIHGLLHGDSAEVRAAAATALGGVPASQSAHARRALLSRYREDHDPTVRKAVLESVVHLDFARALPELQRLRGIDSRLAPEIDAWSQVLGMGLQEWNLILREKQRLQQMR